MLSLIFTVLLLIFGSCGARFVATAPVRPAEPVLANSIAIFSPEQGEILSYEVSPDIDTYWQPRAADIIQLETDLDLYIRRTPELDALASRYRTYQRQYLGYELNGERYIYGNFFCDAFDTNWREQWVIVEDGGDCYFSFSYRVADGIFSSFIVNGES